MPPSTAWQEVLAKRERMQEAHAEAKVWIEQVARGHERRRLLLEKLYAERAVLFSGSHADHGIATHEISGRIQDNKIRRKIAEDALKLRIRDLEKEYKTRSEEKIQLECTYMNGRSVETRSEMYLKAHRELVDELYGLRVKMLELDEREAREQDEAEMNGVDAASTVGAAGGRREERGENNVKGRAR